MMEKVGKGIQKGSLSRHEKWDEKSLGRKLSQGAETLWHRGKKYTENGIGHRDGRMLLYV